MAILNYYLTSLEPNMSQEIKSQSLGGYCSTTLMYPQTLLSQDVGLYETSFFIDVPSEGWTSWNGVTYISINNELMKIENLVTSGETSIDERGTNGILEMHLTGDIVRASSKTDIFNYVFNETNTQYRCIAIRNDDSGNTSVLPSASNINIVLKQNSRNSKANVEIAVEIPSSQYLSGTSTSRTTMTLTDSSISGLYADNYFSECFIKPDGEEGGIVRTFDSSTGTFTYYSSFSTTVTNKIYEVFPSPSQRIKTGIEAPVLSSHMTSFSESSISLDDLYSESGGLVISSNDVFYIWLKRTIEKGATAKGADDFVININYTETS